MQEKEHLHLRRQPGSAQTALQALFRADQVIYIDPPHKAGNVIHQTTDRLQGETPSAWCGPPDPSWCLLDEPQNMESETSIAALAALRPLFALRYSATHGNPYNVVYRLTPFEAYRHGLVKRIEAASVVKEDDQATPYVCLQEIKTQKKTVTARVKVFKRDMQEVNAR